MWPTLFEIPYVNLPIRSYGLMLMIAFLGGTWWAARRAWKVKADPDFVVNLGFVCLLSSIVGARLFYVIHYWDSHFAGKGLWAVVDVSAGGLEFYGGLIGALVAGSIYVVAKRYSLRLYLDIFAPSIMLGMGFARIGCFLNGCCWGGPCPPELPWAVRFPYASPAFIRQWDERVATVPAELIFVNNTGIASPIQRDLFTLTPEEREGPRLAYEEAKEALAQAEAGQASPERLAQLREQRDAARERWQDRRGLVAALELQSHNFDLTPTELRDLAFHEDHRTRPVHPAQLYSSLDGFVLAFLLAVYFHRRKRHGMVFAVMLLTYPPARILEEIIRIDNPHDTAGLTISQFVSVMLFTLGIVLTVAYHRMPLRSKYAIPYVPPPEPEPEPKPAKGKRG